MTWILFLLLFVFGSVMGSFLNVLIMRAVVGEGWVKGRSRCDSCRHQLSWYDNIPLVSFAILKGRCRYCKSRISYQHPLVELMVGLLFVWWGFLGFSFFSLVQSPFAVLQPLYWLLIGFVFLGILFVDFYYGIIPDLFLIFGYAISLFYRFLLVIYQQMRTRDFLLSLVGAGLMFVFFYFLYWVTKKKGMGFGDVKFVPLLGLVLGWPDVLAGVFASFLLGAFVGILLVGLGKKKFGQTLSFGPFLVLGSFVGLLWGDLFWRFLGF